MSVNDEFPATARLNAIAGGSVLPLKTWRHIVVAADGENLQLYEDGKLVASKPCSALAASNSDTVWFGTDASETQVWGDRIDEVALLDRTLNEVEIAALYRTAQDENADHNDNTPGNEIHHDVSPTNCYLPRRYRELRGHATYAERRREAEHRVYLC